MTATRSAATTNAAKRAPGGDGRTRIGMDVVTAVLETSASPSDTADEKRFSGSRSSARAMVVARSSGTPGLITDASGAGAVFIATARAIAPVSVYGRRPVTASNRITPAL